MGIMARPPLVAVINEATCIGCTLCIEACPVDAIVGAATMMHTVIAAECIGCKLCLPPCPVDCISMLDTGHVLTRAEKKRMSQQARSRIKARKQRLAEQHATHAATRSSSNEDAKRATIARAMEKARDRLRAGKRD